MRPTTSYTSDPAYASYTANPRQEIGRLDAAADCIRQLASAAVARRCGSMDASETYPFADDGLGFPNTPLPLLVYRAALTPDPAVMVRAFAEQGWSNAWRDGIFNYHHFHSIAHEVLGIASGEVHVVFGGLSGSRLAVQAGDVMVIPAGVAHFNAGQSPDLLIVGAYPGGSNFDVRRGNPAERETAMRAIASVPLPDNDPVLGQEGGLRRLWTR